MFNYLISFSGISPDIAIWDIASFYDGYPDLQVADIEYVGDDVYCVEFSRRYWSTPIPAGFSEWDSDHMTLYLKHNGAR